MNKLRKAHVILRKGIYKNYRYMKKYLNSIISGKYEEDIDIKQD